MFIDERADDEQADKLGKVFSGQLGGPMAGLAPLVGEVLGVERAAIELTDEGLRHSVRVGDAIDFEVEDIVPFGVETGRAGPVRRHVPPRRIRSHDGGGEALADQRVRDRVRGQDRALDVRVLLGGVITSTTARAAGPAPAMAAARARLWLVALLFVLAAIGWWWTVDRMRGHGRWSVDRPRHARLVPRRVGRDDGRDDVPVARADGRAVLADDEGPDRPAAVHRRLPRDLGRSGRGWRSRSPGPRGDVLAWDRAGRWIAGATLLGRGRLRAHAAQGRLPRKCRSPLGFLLGAWRDGRAGALQMGVRHGGWCVGCCWALMASLFALGVMSIAWMAFVAALIAAEKMLPWRRVATYGTAAILLALGVLLLAAPGSNPGPHDPGGRRRDAGHAGNGGSERGSPRVPNQPVRSSSRFGALKPSEFFSVALGCTQNFPVTAPCVVPAC